MSVMPGPFPDNFPQLSAAQKAELVEKARKKRNVAVTGEISGLVVLALGLGGLCNPWVGVIAFGVGVLLLSIGLELS